MILTLGLMANLSVMPSAHAKPFAKTDEYETIQGAVRTAGWQIDGFVDTNPDRRRSDLPDFVGTLTEQSAFYAEQLGDHIEAIDAHVAHHKYSKDLLAAVGGLTPHGLKSFYYIVHGPNWTWKLNADQLLAEAGDQSAKKVDVAALVKSLEFERWFPFGPSEAEGVPSFFLAPENDVTTRGGPYLEEACTVSGDSPEEIVQSAADALLVIGMLEYGYRYATLMRDVFVEKLETPLKSLGDLSYAYTEAGGTWPESRRGPIDDCRSRFEAMGSLEDRIAEVQAELDSADEEASIRSAFDEAIRQGNACSPQLPEDRYFAYPEHYEDQISDCEAGLEALNATSQAEHGYVQWTPEMQTEAAENRQAGVAALPMLRQQYNQAQQMYNHCTSVANAVYNKNAVMAWKACMSNSEYSQPALQYALTDEDLFRNHMEQNGKVCGGAYNTIMSAHTTCKYLGSDKSLSDLVDDVEYLYEYEAEIYLISLEDMVSEVLAEMEE